MLRSFIKKEIYQNIASKAFWILCVIILGFNILCGVMQISSFNSGKKTYQEYLMEHQKLHEQIPKSTDGSIFSSPVMPPAHLGMIFTGLKQFVGMRAIDQNSIDYLFRNIDFGMLTGILFSLLAIILSFQTISGEREDGMLKLIDSYPVKRAKIIIGKWIGIITIIGILYALCYIVTILLIIIYANTQINFIDAEALLLVYFTGLLYISGIVLLVIFISIKIKYSHLSLLTALLVWALVVLVLPSVPDYAGRLFVKGPSDLQALHDEDEFGTNRQSAIKKIKEKYRENGIADEKTKQEEKIEIEKATNLAKEEQRKKKDNWENKLLVRVLLSTGTSFISPYACYTLAVNEIAATGVSANVLLLKQRDDPKNQINFEYKYPSLLVRLGVAAVPLVLLIVFNILFFVFSFKAFLKYDVR